MVHTAVNSLDGTVNLAEFINRLLSARVVLEKLPISNSRDIFDFSPMYGEKLPELLLKNKDEALNRDPTLENNAIYVNSGNANFIHFYFSILFNYRLNMIELIKECM